VAPDDNIGAISYVQDVKDLGNLEEATIQTFGIKNLDITRALHNVKLPKALFTSHVLKPRQYEEICNEHCPVLAKKIALVAWRKIYRQSPYSSDTRIFLL